MAPQFKKFTDCPENLREAIDWLIQVRHGGDGNGLDGLAKALKKLIDEAMQKAFTSFCDYLCNSLDSAGQRYECCREKIEAIKALKKNVNQAGKVEENKLQALLDKVKAFKNGCKTNHRVDSSTYRALDDVQSRLENLEGLRKNLCGFTTDPNPILENLCAGLETFLGFNSTSKGYDGTGIVYSDLDRLADAVMGFLSGVLGAVKDDESVRMYDNTITGKDAKNISRACEHIESRLQSGNSGFVDSIIQVKQCIDEYLKKVTDLTNNVVGEEGEFKKLEEQIGKNVAAIGKMKENKNTFEDNIGKLYQTINEGLSASIQAVGSAIYALDLPLQNKIKSDFEKIKVQVDTLNDSTVADIMQLKKLSETVRSELRELESTVKVEVANRIAAYRDLLKKDFEVINQDINSVSDTLLKHIQALNVWIKNTEQLVTLAIPQIDAILKEIGENGQDGVKPKAIRTHADTLERKAEELRKAVEKAKMVLNGLIGSIKRSVEALEGVYKATFIKLRNTLEQQVQEAQRVLGELERKVTSDLESTVKNHIKGEIDKVITALQQGLKAAANDESSVGATWIIQNFWINLGGVRSKTNLAAWADQAKNPGDTFNGALELFNNGNRKFEHFRHLLTQLTVRNASGKNFFESIIADLESNLTGAIRGITGNLQDKMAQYHAHAKNQSGGAIHNAIGKVIMDDEYFEDAQAGGASGKKLKQDKLDENGYTKNKGALQTEIGKIRSQGLHLFEKFESPGADEINDKTFITLKTLITQNLDDLVKIIKDNANGSNGVLRKLNDLKTTYFKQENGDEHSIHKIHKDLSILHSHNIATLIKKTTTFLNTIPNQANKCIDAIHRHLIKQVTHTIKNIKNGTLEIYVDRKTKELGELKKLVEQKRLEIEKTITEDSANGVKGLVKGIRGFPIIMKLDGSHGFDLSASSNLLGKLENRQNSKNFKKLAEIFQQYVDNIFQYTGAHIRHTFHILPRERTDNPLYNKIHNLFNHLGRLLDHLKRNDGRIFHFDDESSKLLAEVKNFVGELYPVTFSDASMPVVHAIKSALAAFSDQLGLAHLNTYCSSKIHWNSDTNRDRERCAKICFTIIRQLFHCLHELFYRCAKDWRDIMVDGSGSIKNSNDLKRHMTLQGFDVSSLINKENSGRNVAIKLGKAFYRYSEFHKEPKGKMDLNVYIHTVKNSNDSNTVLLKFSNHLERYFRVSHLSAPQSPKYPCSVFEMLSWVSALKYNALYENITQQCKALANSGTYNTITYMASDLHGIHLPAVSEPIYELLVTIAGTGNAASYYGCAYLSNDLGLHYPSNANNCFDMLLDILRRLWQPLAFLYSQCMLDKLSFGWADCKFGRGVHTSDWQCNPHGDKSSSSTDGCSVSSPLHLYLTDSLRGMLPHHLTSNESKLLCSTCSPSTIGMPCLTPLGFKEFCGTMKTGKDLCYVLGKLCQEDGVLTKLLSLLCCVVNRPPQALPDIFIFYCQLTKSLVTMEPDRAAFKNKDVQNAMCGIIERTVSCEYKDARQLLNACRNLYSSPTHISHNIDSESDLSYLLGCDRDGCGHLLQTLNSTAYSVLAPEHADKYLSWLVYVCTEVRTFLKQLSHEYCNISCFDSGCQGCYHEGKCISGTHGAEECSCISMVHCRGVMPVFYKYGLTYSDASYKSRKRCNYLGKAIDSILKSELLHNFLAAIDTFIFTIRQPFFYTLVALWSLSLLYLFHILIIRLDLLHIKSHLHSPSSHRIAAQSLLAAARVGKLAKISYLQA